MSAGLKGPPRREQDMAETTVAWIHHTARGLVATLRVSFGHAKCVAHTEGRNCMTGIGSDGVPDSGFSTDFVGIWNQRHPRLGRNIVVHVNRYGGPAENSHGADISIVLYKQIRVHYVIDIPEAKEG